MQFVHQLVHVKQVREQSRERERHQAEVRREAARVELEERVQTRLRGDESRARQERAYFDDLCARKVSVSDILLVGHQVGLLKLQAQDELKKEREAGLALDRAQVHLQQTWEALAAARVEHTRTSALQDEWNQVQRVRQIRMEDAGFDEVCELMGGSRRVRPADTGEAT